MAMGDEKRLKWQELSGEERYRVIELLRKGEVEVKELCRTFGVSRQTLYRAAEAADQASVAALTPKRRGRKPEPATGKQLRELEGEKKALAKQLERMSQKYEIAQALLDLQRKAERGERLPGEKKTVRTKKRAGAKGAGATGTHQGMAASDDGRSSGSDGRSGGELGPPAGQGQ
jgi:transposase-like protein